MVSAYNEKESLEKNEYNLSKTEPFINTYFSMKNTVNCLVLSFDLYYSYVEKIKGTLKEGKQPEIKDRLYSIYLKTIVSRLQNSEIKDNGSSGSTCSNTSQNHDKEKSLPKDVLDALSENPKFFLKFAQLFNFIIFDVSNTLILLYLLHYYLM